MESNNKLEAKKQEELKAISLKIIERYKIYDYSLATKIAKEVYNNGIRHDKFKKEYYQDPFNLDEIIYYLIQKEIKHQKIIPFPSNNENPSTLNDLSTKIIPIPSNFPSRIKR